MIYENGNASVGTHNVVLLLYYNGTIYMNVRHHDISVRLVPASHIASFFEVEPFAGVVIPRVHS